MAESLSGELGKKWVEKLLSPASVYWSGVILAYLWSLDPESQQDKFDSVVAVLDENATAIVALTLLAAAGGLVIVSATAALLKMVQFPVLQLLEGYWPSLLRPVTSGLTDRVQLKVEAIDSEWGGLAANFENLTPEQKAVYMRLDAVRARYPEDRSQVLPTALGNVLREAELYPKRRYGLAGVLMWPRLWLILPKENREEIAQQREALNGCVRGCILSVAFLPWVMLAWWAVPVAIIAAITSYRGAVGRAMTYGELTKAAFDVHHRDLLTAMGWTPMAIDGDADPRTVGDDATYFVRRGKTPAEAGSSQASPASTAK